ncbi:hypothetical protein SAMN04515620_11079 [Collimonas sp. OK607]|nr:hypothetical protein SAMN04515620_11079 [Collimonas sp. OK607]
MKTFFICALLLPFLSACATTAADQSISSNVQQESVYTTGSNMPSKKTTSRTDTLSPDQASGLFGSGTTHAPKN